MEEREQKSRGIEKRKEIMVQTVVSRTDSISKILGQKNSKE